MASTTAKPLEHLLLDLDAHRRDILDTGEDWAPYVLEAVEFLERRAGAVLLEHPRTV